MDISQDGNHDDLFGHSTGLIDQINENDRVSYEETDRKGLNAINVQFS